MYYIGHVSLRKSDAAAWKQRAGDMKLRVQIHRRTLRVCGLAVDQWVCLVVGVKGARNDDRP